MTFAPPSKMTGYSKIRSDMMDNNESGVESRVYNSALMAGSKQNTIPIMSTQKSYQSLHEQNKDISPNVQFSNQVRVKDQQYHLEQEKKRINKMI